MPLAPFNPFGFLEEQRLDLSRKFTPMLPPTTDSIPPADEQPYIPQNYNWQTPPGVPPGTIRQTAADVSEEDKEKQKLLDQLDLLDAPVEPEAAPADDKDALLAQLDAMGDPEEEEKSWGQSIYETSVGVRNGLANVILSAPEMAEGLPGGKALSMAQEAMFDYVASKYFDDPSISLTDTAREWLDQKGITNFGLDSLEAKIGQEGTEGLLFLALLRSAAPTMLRAKGASLWPTMQRELGRFLTNHPWLATGTELTGATGTVLGREAAEGQGPVAEGLAGLAGGIAGGMAGGAATSLVSHAGRSAMSGTRKVVEPGLRAIAPNTNAAVMGWLERAGIVRPKPPVEPEALRPTNADPMVTRTFAESQIAAERLAMEEELVKAIEDIPVNVSPEEAAAQARQGLLRAEQISQRVVTDAWQQADLTLRVPIAPIQARAQGMVRELADRPTVLPEKFIRYLMPDEDGAYHGMTFGKAKLPPLVREGDPEEVTIQRLLDFKGLLFRARYDEMGRAAQGKSVNNALARNYLLLENMVDDAIEAAHPKNLRLKQARELSRQHHTLFDPDAINNILAKRSTGQGKLHPSETIEELISNNPGIEQALTIHRTLRGGPLASTFKNRPGYITVQERKELAAMEQQIEDGILASIKDVGQFQDPRKAARFMRQLMPKVRSHASVLARIQHHLGRIDAAEARLKLINQSALERFATQDPKVAITGMFSAQDPAAKARELVRDLSPHPNALEGFRAGVVDELLARTKGEPLRVEKELANPARQRMLKDALGPELYERLERMSKISAGIARGDDMTLRRMLMPTGSIAARVFGAAYGRRVAQATGGGNVQTPGLFANKFAQAFEQIFRSTSADDLFKKAVFDPKWEALLRARTPRNTKELRQFYGRMRRLLITLESGRQAATDGEE